MRAAGAGHLIWLLAQGILGRECDAYLATDSLSLWHHVRCIAITVSDNLAMLKDFFGRKKWVASCGLTEHITQRTA